MTMNVDNMDSSWKNALRTDTGCKFPLLAVSSFLFPPQQECTRSCQHC